MRKRASNRVYKSLIRRKLVAETPKYRVHYFVQETMDYEGFRGRDVYFDSEGREIADAVTGIAVYVKRSAYRFDCPLVRHQLELARDYHCGAPEGAQRLSPLQS